MPSNIKKHILVAVGLIVAAICLIGVFKTKNTSPEYNQRLSRLSDMTNPNALLEIPESAPAFNPVDQAEVANVMSSVGVESPMELAPQFLTEPASDFELSPAITEVDQPLEELTQGVDPAQEFQFPEEPEMVLEPEVLMESSELQAPQVDVATDQSVDFAETAPELVTPMPPVEFDTATPIISDTQAAPIERRFHQAGSSWKRNPFVTESTLVAQETANRQASLNTQIESGVNTSVRSLNVIPGVNSNGPGTPVSEPTPADYGQGASEYSQVAPVNSQVTPDESITPVSTMPLDVSIAPMSMELSDTAAQQAVHHIEYGKSLSRRGSTFAARQEFLTALRVIAQSNDATIGGNEFSVALANAIRAMKESEEFVLPDSEAGVVIDVASVMESHQTRILTQRDAKRMTARQAESQYLAYAAQQLDMAGGRNIVTAEALSCLGKLHTFMSGGKNSAKAKKDMGKAIVFHKSSLQSNSNNPSSANELGVLMAKTGDLQEATQLFKQSLIAQSTPQAWSNLAKIHQRLGEQQMAQLAQSELARSANANQTIATSGIQWVGVPQFNAMVKNEFEPRVATNTQPLPVPKPEAEPDEEVSGVKAFGQKIKSAFTIIR